MNPIKKFAKTTYKSMHDAIMHDGIEHAGYIAFLSVLSVFPFLVFFLAIASFVGQSEIGTKFISIILHNDLVPQHVKSGLEPRINELLSGPPQQLLTLSIIGTIWTASSMLEGLRTILNRAYRVNTPPAYILRRLLSVAQLIMITGIVTLVIFILIITPNIWMKIESFINPQLLIQVKDLFNLREASFNQTAWHISRYAITNVIIFIMVAISYFIIPNIKQRWNDVAPGALFVALLWNISGYLFSVYLSNFQQVSIVYGSLGGIIAVLLFFYISAIIYVFGAEFNYHVAKSRGHHIKSKE